MVSERERAIEARANALTVECNGLSRKLSAERNLRIAAEAERDRALAALARLEWSARNYYREKACPACGGVKPSILTDPPLGHNRGCWLAGILLAAPAGQAGAEGEPA